MSTRKPKAAAKPAADAPARPANADRGEIALALDGVQMVMRPSYEAILAFEASTGKGIFDLANAAVAGRLTLGETAQIAAECIRAWGRATGDRGYAGSTPANVGRLIMESPGGLRVAMSDVGGMLALAVTGEYTASGELKATVTTTNVQPVAA